jgi:hypothetical protein
VGLELGLGVLEPAAVVPAAVVAAAVVPADEAVALVKVPLLTGTVTLAATDETGTGTTTVVGTTTEMTPGNMLGCVSRAIEQR